MPMPIESLLRRYLSLASAKTLAIATAEVAGRHAQPRDMSSLDEYRGQALAQP